MLITIASFIIVLLVGFYSQTFQPTLDFSVLILLLLTAGSVVLFITSLSQALVLGPLQKLEDSLIPRLIVLFHHDVTLRLSLIYLFFFSFLSYALAFLFAITEMPDKLMLFMIWIVTLGFALDLIKNRFKRIELFLNPFYSIELFISKAKQTTQDETNNTFWDSLDSLSEIALQATEKNKIALSTQSLSAFPSITQSFFESLKNIGRFNQDEKIKSKTGRDEASYTIFYILQRLETIYDKALKQNLEIVCSHLIMILGKIIIYSARFDLSMVSFPTYFLGRCALKAQNHHLNETANLANSTLSEISRMILTEMDLTYMELQDAFQAIVSQLDAIAKETFRKDKTLNIKLLIQPFQDLKKLFQTEKMANHPDTSVIVQSIDHTLAEFEMLEQVMRTIPPISTIMESSPQPT